jgi:hypothetical protein
MESVEEEEEEEESRDGHLAVLTTRPSGGLSSWVIVGLGEPNGIL